MVSSLQAFTSTATSAGALHSCSFRTTISHTTNQRIGGQHAATRKRDMHNHTRLHVAPEVTNRADSWGLLRQLNDCPYIPWCVLGDFNEILCSAEKVGGLQRVEWQMQNFRDALLDCALDDMGYKGIWYTWEWGRSASNNIRCRLDRGVATLQWFDLFLNYQLDHLTHSISDHFPLMLTSNIMHPRRDRVWHFKFEAA
ncbi:hypothetical protein V6N12_031469 [Hibiscus sabdariffa]|uniref:Uncharacterized protein n=1 Tax=Hibiscus sabdariffa TaxID=183260 RepID=A0ABR2CPC8_9ROSI